MFEGVLPAIITPFQKDGKLDEEGLKKNIALLGDTGISGIVPCGTTGESATLNFQEHKRVVEVAVEYSRVPVVAGTGSNNTVEAVELTRHAADIGADAALLITPYYNRPNDRGLKEHFRVIASSADIPIILYNVPSRTGVNMKPEVTAELAKIPNIMAVKEASGDLKQISRILELTADEEFSLLSGDDDLTLPMLALGARGVISVVANVAPRKTVAMVEAFKNGDIVGAQKLHYQLAPLVRAMFLETNPIPVKTACNLMGLAGGPLRLPLGPLSQDNTAKLKEVLDKLGEFR